MTPPLKPSRRQRVRRRRLVAVATLLLVGLGIWAIARGGGGGSTPTARGEDVHRPIASRPPQARPTADPTRRLRVAAVGDIVMGSLPYGLPPDGGASFFAPVASLLTGDVVIGNLEGTLSTGGSSKCGAGGGSNCFAFHTPPSYARWLRRAGFTVMNLANNHALDYGPHGERETVAALDAVHVANSGRPGQITVLRAGGLRVAVLGFAPYRWASSLTDLPAARRLVAKAAATADIVLVMIHAGAEGADRTHVRPGPETYLGEPRGDSLAFAHAVVDAGADLVLGSGPHVMRGMEVYRGRLVAYSLGNFAGYRVFGLGGTLSTSGVLQATLRGDGRFVAGQLRPTELVGAGTPAPGGDAVQLVSQLSREDFGRRAARIAPDGSIAPPA